MTRIIRLTMAQALVKFLQNQWTEIDGERLPIFAGCFAIFGHGNVAGLGEALYQARDAFPTYRAHNEQSMAHAAIAFAKANMRKRFMVATTSIGPGALNLITPAGVAHVNRLPVLFLPGDVFASRSPDPVLQQVEDFADGTVSASDAFRPVSRYFDRITRPEQIMPALRRAMHVLTDPAGCGPVTLSLCQDVQAEAFDYPEAFFEPRLWTTNRRSPVDEEALAEAVHHLKQAEKPMIIAGGGVLYSGASTALTAFAEQHGIAVSTTQAGKSAIDESHPLALGAIGVTGTAAANLMAEEADVILAIGTRLQDFTTGSRALFKNPDLKMLALNIAGFDATKHGARALIGDAGQGLAHLTKALGDYKTKASYQAKVKAQKDLWAKVVEAAFAPQIKTASGLASDAQVIGAVTRAISPENAIIVCAAGGLPGELHRLWPATQPGSYHVEYGFSCMGYEIAGGMGVKMARSESHVIVMVGDGSYMMANSEIATAVMMGIVITIVVLDNRGFGCINRLQRATGGASFNNLLADSYHLAPSAIDFAAHARAMGADAVKVTSLTDLEAEVKAAGHADKTRVIVIDTDPLATTEAGGHWWDVAVPQTSPRDSVKAAYAAYEKAKQGQKI